MAFKSGKDSFFSVDGTDISSKLTRSQCQEMLTP